ncbi:MAG: carbon-nitrogen hydrolase family protein [Pseudomonadota bacterium]
MLRVGLIQLCSGLDRAQNVETTVALVKEAAAKGARFIATPEMTNVVDKRPRRLCENLPFEKDLTEIKTFADLAKELDIYLLIGSLAVALNKEPGARQVANRSYLFGPKGQIATYDKVHLFDVELPSGESWKESSTYQAGAEAVVAQTALGGIGLSICYDVRFPHLYRKLAQNGAQILAVPAAFTVPTGEAHWAPLLRARAIETGSFVIAPAQGGIHEDGRVTYGHSMIIDPWGRILGEKADDRPGILTAALDLSHVAATRQRIPSLGLDRPCNLRMYSE